MLDVVEVWDWGMVVCAYESISLSNGVWWGGWIGLVGFGFWVGTDGGVEVVIVLND